MLVDIKKLEHAPHRATEMVSMFEVFGVGDPSIMIEKFVEPGPFTPKLDPDYIFKKTDTIYGLMALEHKQNCYFVGHSGTGKTEWIKQVAARLNYNVVLVGFDGHLLRSDLIGAHEIRAMETPFKYGLVPQAFRMPGTILALDEIDACASETAFVLQSALSEARTLYLTETNEIIELHPQNCIMATANTTGQGDESGLYLAGTNVQNFSLLNRFKTTLKFDYLSFDDEVALLTKKYPGEDLKVVRGVCAILREVRNAFKAGSISRPLTTRDGINWLGKIDSIGYPMYSAGYAFLNLMSDRDANAVAEYIMGVFDPVAGDDQKYVGRAKKVINI